MNINCLSAEHRSKEYFLMSPIFVFAPNFLFERDLLQFAFRSLKTSRFAAFPSSNAVSAIDRLPRVCLEKETQNRPPYFNYTVKRRKL